MKINKKTLTIKCTREEFHAIGTMFNFEPLCEAMAISWPKSFSGDEFYLFKEAGVDISKDNLLLANNLKKTSWIKQAILIH